MGIQIDCEVVQVTHRDMQFSFAGYTKDHITEMMKPGRFYEADLLDAIYQRYGTGGVYYDFGAFIGTHSVFFEKVCKADLVCAVEGYAQTAFVCKHNLDLNGCTKTELMQVLVGDIQTRATWCEPAGNYGSMTVIPSEKIEGSCPVLRSGSLITAPPKLIKIDVEGATLAALIGCVDEIKEYKPIVVIEARFGEEYDEISGILFQAGYKLFNTYAATPTHIFEPDS